MTQNAAPKKTTAQLLAECDALLAEANASMAEFDRLLAERQQLTAKVGLFSRVLNALVG